MKSLLGLCDRKNSLPPRAPVVNVHKGVPGKRAIKTEIPSERSNFPGNEKVAGEGLMRRNRFPFSLNLLVNVSYLSMSFPKRNADLFGWSSTSVLKEVKALRS